jgi:hypothetical protein
LVFVSAVYRARDEKGAKLASKMTTLSLGLLLPLVSAKAGKHVVLGDDNLDFRFSAGKTAIVKAVALNNHQSPVHCAQQYTCSMCRRYYKRW